VSNNLNKSYLKSYPWKTVLALSWTFNQGWKNCRK